MALFTQEELEAIPLADAEIEENFHLTNEDLRSSRKIGRQAQLEALPPDRRKRAEQQKAWYEANREKVAEQQKAYREANREKVAEQQKAWRKKNPDYFRQRYQRLKKTTT
jgi:hypothetical protein